jgi:hypothetical protein
VVDVTRTAAAMRQAHRPPEKSATILTQPNQASNPRDRLRLASDLTRVPKEAGSGRFFGRFAASSSFPRQ